MKTVYTFIAGNEKLKKRRNKLFWAYINERHDTQEYRVKKARFERFDAFCHRYYDLVKPSEVLQLELQTIN